MSKKKSVDYLILAAAVFIVCAISLNIAWLNPRPDFKGNMMKPSLKYPVLWQYNEDSHIEFYSALDFPEGFRKTKIRINRPLYPFLVHYLGKFLHLLPGKILRLKIKTWTMVAYILLNVFMLLLASVMMYEILDPYCGGKAVFPVLLMIFHPFTILSVSVYHTLLLQFVTPVIAVYLFGRLSRSYSFHANAFCSFLFGMLMLGKQNYAVYVAIICVLLARKYLKEVLVSVFFHLLPLLIWLLVLKGLGIGYYNHEAQRWDQGVWLYRSIVELNLFQIMKNVVHSISSYFILLSRFFSLWLFTALYGLGGRKQDGTVPVAFIFWFSLALWFQLFVSNWYSFHMVADVSILIYGLTGICLFDRLSKPKAFFVIGCWIICSITSIANYPWIHPMFHGL